MNGSIRQRPKGTWQLRYDAPPDGTGNIIRDQIASNGNDTKEN